MQVGVLLALCLAMGCGVARPAAPQSASAIEFAPLESGEILSSSYRSVADGVELSLYRVDMSSRASVLLFKRGGVEPQNVVLAAKGKLAYFIVYATDPKGFDTLWVVDGRVGRSNPAVEASPVFAVSEDGRFVCFDDLKYQTESGSSFPRVSVYDVKDRKVTKRVDYADEKYRGTDPTISYDGKRNSFHLEFTAEDRTVGSSDIEIP